MSVKRYKLNELKNFNLSNLSKMSDSELRRATSDIQSVAKRRSSRLIDKGYEYSPAMNRINEMGGFKTLRGLNRDDVIKEFNKARTFVNTGVSTIRGINKYKSFVEQKYGKKISSADFNKYMKAINKVQEINPNLGLNYEQTVTDLIDTVKNQDIDVNNIIEIEQELTRKNQESYEKTVYNDDDLFMM